MSAGWIMVDKSSGSPLVKRKVETITDTVQEHLKSVEKELNEDISDSVKNDYKKRKLLQEIIIKSFVLRKGPEFTTTVTKLETDLTTEMLANGSWNDLKFKAYNFDALGTYLYVLIL